MMEWGEEARLQEQLFAMQDMKYREFHSRLPEWVHRKTIQKAVESYRITLERKEYLKGLRKCRE